MMDFEITKREILFSICIIMAFLMGGLFFTNKITDSVLDKNEKYNKAVKIEGADLFQYGMDTNVGNAFVYGKLETVDPVTFTEIGGDYMHVEKVKERYTMHTRTVRYKVGKHYKTRVETYWTWDFVGKETETSKEIKFSGITFPTEKIDIPSANYIKTIKESSHIRYKYYGTPTEFKGTIFTELKDGTILNDSDFYNKATLEEAHQMCTTNSSVYVGLFWILWIALTAISVYGFYRLENRWLE